MSVSRLPLAAGIVLAVAATLYFTQRDDSQLLIALHGVTVLLFLAGLVSHFSKATLGAGSLSQIGRMTLPKVRRSVLAASVLVALLWLLAQIARLTSLTTFVTPLFLGIALITFLIASFAQDVQLPVKTRSLRIIDGFLLGFVVLGLEWFSLVETAELTRSLIVFNVLLSLPFVSLLLFVIYSQRIEIGLLALGVALASVLMVAWVNEDGKISPMLDLVAMSGFVALSTALTTRSSERRPSLLGPLVPYLLGVLVIVLGVFHAVLGTMTRTDVALIAAVGLALVSRQTYALIEQRQLIDRVMQHENQLRHVAMHDMLTSLPNRTLFQDRLEHAVAMRMRDGGELSLIYIDINDFKRINDEYGHVFGDELLIHVALRLATWVRPSDTVARLGGDEFVVLMESGRDGAHRVAQRLSSELARPYVIAERSLNSSASIGIYTCSDWDGEAVEIAERIVNRADRAMYLAKSEGLGVRIVE